jgi:hypothetical protein
MRKLALAVLASTCIALPAMAVTAQAQKYQVTSISKIAPNTLKYLLSHYTGAGALDSKMAALEAEISKGGVTIEGAEGRQGSIGERGPAGPQGEPGESVEGPEGRASTVPGPQGIPGESIVGEQGPEGAASEVPGPAGPRGEKGERGPACEVKVEPACASTVPGPTGPEGKASTVPGPRGETGPASTVPGPRGEVGPAGPQGAPGPEGKGGTPTAYVTSAGAGGGFWNGNPEDSEIMSKNLPAGQYVITGSVTFTSGSKTVYPAQLECRLILNGATLLETPDIVNEEYAAAVLVSSTGETSGGMLEVWCEPNPNDGFGEIERTKVEQGSLAATGVTFK